MDNIRAVIEYFRYYESCKGALYDLVQFLNYKGVKTQLISIPILFIHFIYFPDGANEDIKRVLNLSDDKCYVPITAMLNRIDIISLGDVIFRLF